MNRNVKMSTTFARLAALALIGQAALVGCGSSDDGPMLSDEEKLQRAQQGRQAYSQGDAPKPPANAGGTGR
jgi:hypothetical protein